MCDINFILTNTETIIVTKKDEEWWIKTFEKNGFELVKFSYEFGSIKKKWVDKFPYGNGFFILNHDDSYDG